MQCCGYHEYFEKCNLTVNALTLPTHAIGDFIFWEL